jgi:hypothetical protein
MTDNTATPARQSRRTQNARPGQPIGRLTVGEYVGQQASLAAQAIRGSGLRPSLELSYGCDAEMHARVVAQEPPAGSDLARNSMVTLYVGTTGAGPSDEQPEAVAAEVDDQQSLAPALAEPGEHEADTEAVDLLSDDDFGDTPDWWDYTEEPAESDGEDLPEEDAEPVAEDEASREQAVAQADDLFAGRAGPGVPPWRSVYPRRSVHGRRKWQLRPPAAGLAVLALCGALAIGVLAGQHAARTSGAARAPVAAATVTSPQTHTNPARSRVQSEPAPRRHPRGPRPMRRVARRAAAAPVARARAAQESDAANAQPAPASAPPAPASEQTGGPFSP